MGTTFTRDSIIKINTYVFCAKNFDIKSLTGHGWYFMNHSQDPNVEFNLLRSSDTTVIGFEVKARRKL